MSALSPGAPTSNDVADMCPTGCWLHVKSASAAKIARDGSVKSLRERGTLDRSIALERCGVNHSPYKNEVFVYVCKNKMDVAVSSVTINLPTFVNLCIHLSDEVNRLSADTNIAAQFEKYTCFEASRENIDL